MSRSTARSKGIVPGIRREGQRLWVAGRGRAGRATRSESGNASSAASDRSASGSRAGPPCHADTRPGVRSGGRRRWANSTSSGRVSRGSMISSIRKASAVRNGERTSVQPRLDLGPQRRRIVSLLQVGLVGRLDAALDRQRAPVARRPRVPVLQLRPRSGGRRRRRRSTRRRMTAHNGTLGLVDGGQRAGALPDGRGPLGVGADHEARAGRRGARAAGGRCRPGRRSGSPCRTRRPSIRRRRRTGRSRARRPASRRAAPGPVTALRPQPARSRGTTRCRRPTR